MTDYLGIYALIGGFGLAVSVAVSGFMTLAGVGDVPNMRSSHSKVTPSCGGLGLVAALGAVIILSALFFPDILAGRTGVEGRQTAELLLIAFGVALIGVWDDVKIAKPGPKLFLLFLLSLAAASIIGPVMRLPFGDVDIILSPIVGLTGTALWIFVMMNAVNFMDGINGLVASTLSCISVIVLVLAIFLGAPQSALWALTILVGLAGFLPYNYRKKAALFMGDVGALLAGFIIAVSMLFLIAEAPDYRLLYLAPLLLMPFLADVFLTLVMRVKMGESLVQPHRKHLYQKLVETGFSHLRVTRWYVLAALLCAIFGFMCLSHGAISHIWPLTVATLATALVYCVALMWLHLRAS